MKRFIVPKSMAFNCYLPTWLTIVLTIITLEALKILFRFIEDKTTKPIADFEQDIKMDMHDH